MSNKRKKKKQSNKAKNKNIKPAVRVVSKEETVAEERDTAATVLAPPAPALFEQMEQKTESMSEPVKTEITTAAEPAETAAASEAATEAEIETEASTEAATETETELLKAITNIHAEPDTKTDFHRENISDTPNGFTKKSNKKPVKKYILSGIALLAAIGIIFGIGNVIRHHSNAYLKPYEKQYGITFPEGIRKEFCDAYGQNQNLVGQLRIADTKTEIMVSSATQEGYAKMQRGSDIFMPQQFRAISLTRKQADLEHIYNTTDGYLSSSQYFTFTSLFEEKAYHIIAVYYTNTRFEDNHGYRYPYNLYGNLTEKSFSVFQDRMESRRLYDTGYKYNANDEFLTISVDSDFMPHYRFVVVGVYGKDFRRKSGKIKENKNIHFPQSYYDAKKIDNPYIYTGKWYPEIYTDEARTQTKKLTMADFE